MVPLLSLLHFSTPSLSSLSNFSCVSGAARTTWSQSDGAAALLSCSSDRGRAHRRNAGGAQRLELAHASPSDERCRPPRSFLLRPRGGSGRRHRLDRRLSSLARRALPRHHPGREVGKVVGLRALLAESALLRRSQEIGATLAGGLGESGLRWWASASSAVLPPARQRALPRHHPDRRHPPYVASPSPSLL